MGELNFIEDNNKWTIKQGNTIDDKQETTVEQTSTDLLEWLNSTWTKKWEVIEQYKHDTHIEKLLNQEYYKSDDGGFSWWMGGIVDEWNTIFAISRRNSKIFNFDENEITQKWEEYDDIKTCWDFYIWIKIDSASVDNGDYEKNSEGFTKYIILDKKWNKIKNLRWHLVYNEKDDIYAEHYKTDNQEKIAYYDKDMNLLIEDLEQNTILLKYEWTQVLLCNRWNQEKDNTYTIIDTSLNNKYNTISEIKDEEIYINYKKEQEQKNVNYKQEVEKKAKEKEWLSLDFNIEFESDKRYVSKITNKSGAIIFETHDENKYEIDYPSQNELINNGIFLLKGIKDHTYNESIFINANENITLKLDKYPSTTSLKGKTIQNFINSSDAELYDFNGKKLGIVLDWDHNLNEHYHKIITNNNNKKQIVENSTWKLIEQEFEKTLRKYDKKNEQIIVAENEWKLIEIHIKK